MSQIGSILAVVSRRNLMTHSASGNLWIHSMATLIPSLLLDEHGHTK